MSAILGNSGAWRFLGYIRTISSHEAVAKSRGLCLHDNLLDQNVGAVHRSLFILRSVCRAQLSFSRFDWSLPRPAKVAERNVSGKHDRCCSSRGVLALQLPSCKTFPFMPDVENSDEKHGPGGSGFEDVVFGAQWLSF